MLLTIFSQHKRISRLLTCPKTQTQAWTAFIAPPSPPRSYFSLSSSSFFPLNGMKVAVAGIQDHRARDHTDGGEIKKFSVSSSQCCHFSTRVTRRRRRKGSHLQPWHHCLIAYRVSPAAPRRAHRDRSHLSSLRGSQYNLPDGSDIQRREAQ